MFQANISIDVSAELPGVTGAPETLLAQLMANYPCYAFVANDERTAPKALFRGRWTWEAVSTHLSDDIHMIVVNDERASGFIRFRLYGMDEGCPVSLAEIEVYFARGEGRTSFWCQMDEVAGALSLAA